MTDAATHRILDINPAAADLIGLPRDQILGEEGHRFIRPAGAGRSSIASPGQPVDTSERVLLTADKRSVPVIDYITPVTLSGTPCLLETFIDNTERKQAELDLLNAYGELMKSAQSLRESEEQVPDPVRFGKRCDLPRKGQEVCPLQQKDTGDVWLPGCIRDPRALA